MKKNVCVAIVIIFLSIVSCSQDKSNKDKYSLSTHRFIDSTYNFYKNGRIVYNSINSVAMYTDFATMETIPLCSRPNCTHKNSECVARLVGEIPIVYDDMMYYLTYTSGVNENGKGKREYYINSELNSVSLKTFEVKKITEFHDCAPYTEDGFYLDGNELYFIATDMGVEQDAYGNIISSNVGGNQYLCSVNLDGGEYSNYGIIYDGDKNYEEAKRSRHAFIVGGRDSKINIFYSFLPETPHMDSDITASDFTMLGVDFDLNSKTFSEGNEISPSFSDENSFVGYDNKAGKMYIDFKGKNTIFEVEDRDEVSVVNGKLFDAKKGIWVDLDSNKEHSMGKYNGYIAITLWKDYYILTKGASTVKITEEELMRL